MLFQSPRSGQICLNFKDIKNSWADTVSFQSPRSGQICSNALSSSNSLDIQMMSFNPLDRVKFVQIFRQRSRTNFGRILFQSPRSGQICSNADVAGEDFGPVYMFQSPRSGQICLNVNGDDGWKNEHSPKFQSPRSGQICSNLF